MARIRENVLETTSSSSFPVSSSSSSGSNSSYFNDLGDCMDPLSHRYGRRSESNAARLELLLKSDCGRKSEKEEQVKGGSSGDSPSASSNMIRLSWEDFKRAQRRMNDDVGSNSGSSRSDISSSGNNKRRREMKHASTNLSKERRRGVYPCTSSSSSSRARPAEADIEEIGKECGVVLQDSMEEGRKSSKKNTKPRKEKGGQLYQSVLASLKMKQQEQVDKYTHQHVSNFVTSIQRFIHC